MLVYGKAMSKIDRCKLTSVIFPAILLGLVTSTIPRSELLYAAKHLNAQGQNDYAGSSSCRQCHERFYKLWAPSHHGLAMQPYTAEFAKANLTPQAADIKTGKFKYRAEIEANRGWVREIGPEGEKTYPMVHVLGGKNVFYCHLACINYDSVRGRFKWCVQSCLQ